MNENYTQRERDRQTDKQKRQTNRQTESRERMKNGRTERREKERSGVKETQTQRERFNQMKIKCYLIVTATRGNWRFSHRKKDWSVTK